MIWKLCFSRISGLDPAFYGFYPPLIEGPVSKDDAEFVDTIHTDSFWIGSPYPAGHVSFFPNDAKIQPGCPPLRFAGYMDFINSKKFHTIYTIDFFKECLFYLRFLQSSTCLEILEWIC